MSPAGAETMNQELLATPRRGGRPPPLPETAPEKEKRSAARRFFRALVYSSIALFSFLAFFIAKLPADRLGPYALEYLSQQTAYEWRAQKTELGLLLGPSITFKELEIVRRGFGASQRPLLKLDSVTLRPQLLSMIPLPGLREAAQAASFELEAFQGSASGVFTASPGGVALELSGSGMKLEKMDFLRAEADLDLRGTVNTLKMDFRGPGKLSRSEGNIDLQATGFQMDPAGLNLGLPLPMLEIGPVVIRATIRAGRLSFERGALGGTGRDVEINAEGGLNLKDPFEFSDLDLRLRLKVSEKITKALPYVETMLAPNKRADGYYGLKLSGNLAAPALPTPYLN